MGFPLTRFPVRKPSKGRNRETTDELPLHHRSEIKKILPLSRVTTARSLFCSAKHEVGVAGIREAHCHLHGVAHSPNHNLCPLLIHHALDGGHVVGALEVVVFNARGSGNLLSSLTQV